MTTDIGHATLETGWAYFARHTLPPDLPAGAFVNCRRAFYAGAAHVFDHGVEASALSRSDAMNLLAVYQGELEDFKRRVGDGSA